MNTAQLTAALPPAVVPELEALCVCFEEALRRGEKPLIDDFLPAARPAREAALVELVRVEIELRRRDGETVTIEEYFDRYPLLHETPAAVQLLLADRRSGVPAPDTLPPVIPPPTPPGLPRFPGYEVLDELGRGAMGVVYRARQTKLNRVVALKAILSPAPSADAAERGRFHDFHERFQREVEAVARLQHPHITQIFEVGWSADGPFFSLEFCPGGTLDRKLGGTPLPPAQSAALVEPLARAVHTAHQQQIVHRDLKPANVLLAADGTPKVADFGLARRLDDAGRTRPGDILGTPSYMAPEQAGKAHEAGPAADVYALGAILYECLTGRPPFKAATALDTLAQVIHDDPVPPRRLQPKTPRDLDTVCLKCLQKDIKRRYASAEALAEDLRRFRVGEPVLARPISSLERLTKWARRRPAAAALLATVVLLLAVGSVALGLYLKMGIDERNHADAEKARVDKDVNDLQNMAENQQKQGRYGAAADALSKVVLLLKGRPDRADDRKRQDARRDQFARLDEFLRNSDRAWFAAGEERGGEVRMACEKALNCYRVLDCPDWRTREPAADLPTETAVPVQREVHRLLLLLAAMRLKDGIRSSIKWDWKEVRTHCDDSLAVLDRARQMEEEGVVEPSKTTAILTKGVHGLANPLAANISSLTPASPSGPPGDAAPDDLSADDAFFLGVMHVYLAKQPSDGIASIVRRLGPREFDYDHARATAVRMLRLAVQKEARPDYWSFFMLGRILQYGRPGEKADYQAAWDAFTVCIALRPDYSRGYEQRGLTLVLQAQAQDAPDETTRKGILQSAHNDFDKAMALAPDDPSTYWVRGQMLQLLNEGRESVKAYNHALDLLSDLPERDSWRNQLRAPKQLVQEMLLKDPHDQEALDLSDKLQRADRDHTSPPAHPDKP